MRLAVLFDAYPHAYGGAQRIDHLLAARLPAHGWDVVVVVPATGPFVDRLAADGVRCDVVPVPAALARYGGTTSGWRAAWAIARLPGWWVRLLRDLRRRRPALVSVVDHRGMLLAGLPARLARARVVWHIHSVNRSRWINRFGAKLAHEVVVPTRAVLREMPDLSRARALRAVPNAVRDDARRATPVELPRAAVITTIARLHPEKGVDVLVEALAFVQRRVPEARLVAIGPVDDSHPSHPSELEALARTHGIDGSFELAGFVEHPESVVAASRCYVQPSRTEILPLAILEAMAAGIPVVATDVGGVAEIVHHGTTGLLAPAEDPERLATAIADVLSDDGLADRLRRAAFGLVADRRYTVDGFVDAMVAAYEGRR